MKPVILSKSGTYPESPAAQGTFIWPETVATRSHDLVAPFVPGFSGRLEFWNAWILHLDC